MDNNFAKKSLWMMAKKNDKNDEKISEDWKSSPNKSNVLYL
jgi:hypothetical protein